MKPGWRKWTLSVVGILTAFILALAQKLTGEYVTIVTLCVGTYNAANAYSKKVYTDGRAS